MAKRFLLIDRDGTLIVEKNYLHDPDEVELIPGTIEALKSAREAGWGLVCVTNQSGVARGKFPESDIPKVHDRIQQLLGKAKIDKFYYCIDGPDQPSTRRKPAPGMAQEAAKDFGFDLTKSIVIGDKPSDIEMGQAVGAITVLVRTGYGSQHEAGGDCQPDFVIDSLADLSAILNQLPR